MKKLVIGLMIASAVLTACGKKGKGGGGGGGPAVGAAGACPLDQFGRCVGGVGQSGVVPANTWEGNVSVTEGNKYRQFLLDNSLCFGLSCQNVSGFFKVAVQTIRDQNGPGGASAYASLPGDVNFLIVPRMNGWGIGNRLNTRGEGYINGAGNGFQVNYNRNLYGGGYYGPQYRPGLPYGQVYPGYPGYQQPIAPQTNMTLQIVLTWADATQTIANVSLIYQGVQFATGQLRGRFWAGNGAGPLNTNGNPQNAPAVLPPRNSDQPWQ